MADAARINGLQISFSSIKLKVDGEPFTGFTSIKYDDGIETQYSYGSGRARKPRGRTGGKYMPEPLVITMAKSSAQTLRAQLAASSPTGKSYGMVEVPIVLQYIEPDDATITVEFDRARYVKTSASNEDSADPSNEEITFSVMGIKRNGLVIYDDREEAGA